MANCTVWLILRRHTTKVKEMILWCIKQEGRFVIFFPENCYFPLYAICIAHLLKAWAGGIFRTIHRSYLYIYIYMCVCVRLRARASREEREGREREEREREERGGERRVKREEGERGEAREREREWESYISMREAALPSGNDSVQQFCCKFVSVLLYLGSRWHHTVGQLLSDVSKDPNPVVFGVMSEFPDSNPWSWRRSVPWNVSKKLPKHTAQKPRRPTSSTITSYSLKITVFVLWRIYIYIYIYMYFWSFFLPFIVFVDACWQYCLVWNVGTMNSKNVTVFT